ncbi:MAG: hypothetical protein A2X59_05505 [Nitrospirae bacterium GWC2_42_7]|nr:MAG: hypothetical protein A2X59_05505 [Nitrospirae bacterium GWC2_42_7]HBO84468.1 hypothetical protein [Deltaproteobacteria bacterium]
MKIKVRNQNSIVELNTELGDFLKAEKSLREQIQEINRLATKYGVRFMKPVIEQKGKRDVVADIQYEKLPEFFDPDELAKKYGSVDKGISQLQVNGYKFLSMVEDITGC